MTVSKLLLDLRNQKLLAALLKNPRASITALARRVGLSAPATRERLLRLEEASVIKGWRVELDPKALGCPIAVLIRVRFEGYHGATVSLSRADFSGAALFDIDFQRANLYGAQFRQAMLVRCDLRGTNLCNADLRGVRLVECDLSGAELDGVSS